jgi:hypothetical protein
MCEKYRTLSGVAAFEVPASLVTLARVSHGIVKHV